MARELVLSAEEACDDWAVALTGQRKDYATTLVDWAEAATAVAGLPCAPRGRALVKRVRHILQSTQAPRLHLSWHARTILAVCAVGMVVLVASVHLRAVPADDWVSLPAPTVSETDATELANTIDDFYGHLMDRRWTEAMDMVARAGHEAAEAHGLFAAKGDRILGAVPYTAPRFVGPNVIEFASLVTWEMRWGVEENMPGKRQDRVERAYFDATDQDHLIWLGRAGPEMDIVSIPTRAVNSFIGALRSGRADAMRPSRRNQLVVLISSQWPGFERGDEGVFETIDSWRAEQVSAYGRPRRDRDIAMPYASFVGLHGEDAVVEAEVLYVDEARDRSTLVTYRCRLVNETTRYDPETPGGWPYPWKLAEIRVAKVTPVATWQDKPW